MTAKDLASIKHLHLLAGKLSVPGAPMLQLALGYNQETGNLNGEALITQSIMPPAGRVEVQHLTGRVHFLGFGPTQQVFTVEGEYYVPFPPPAIGMLTERFSATFLTDSTWHGHGSFTYGNHRVENVPVEPAQ
jgi:hypothetical protein